MGAKIDATTAVEIEIEQLVQRYLDTWNEGDPARRRALIEALYADDATYVDPHAELSGRDAIHAFVGGVRERFPGVVFSLGGPIDAHHAQARFHWHARIGEAAPMAIGFDVMVVERGRVQRVYGFSEPRPS